MTILSEVLSLVGIYAELLLPLLSGMLIDFVIQSGEVREDSGGMFHFLLTGKYGEPNHGIAEEGAHEELMAKKGLYYDLAGGS